MRSRGRDSVAIAATGWAPRGYGLQGAMAVMVLCGSSAAADASAWYEGEWCGEDGRYAIDAHGAGAGDHVICDWVGAPPAGRARDGRLRCEARYPNGEEVVRMNAGIVRVQGSSSKTDELTLTFSGPDGPEHLTYRRCD